MTDTKAVVLGNTSPNQSIWGIGEENIKHVNTKEELQHVALKLEVRSDWHEPDEQGLTAEFHGKSFGNDGIWGHKVAITPDNLEQYITLHKDNRPVAEINLATLFSWAADISPKKADIVIEHHDYFDLPGFEEFLMELLVAQPSETIKREFLDFNTLAVCSAIDGNPCRRSWAMAQVSADEDKILVSNTTGVHIFDCMTFQKAWDELQDIISKGAEGINSLSTLFEIVAERVPGMDAAELFKKATGPGNAHIHSSIDWYKVLEDLRLSAEDVISDYVDALDSSDADDEDFIDTAADHFGLDADMILESAGCDHQASDEDWIALAEDMDMEVPEAVRLAIEKGDPRAKKGKVRHS